MFTQIFSILAKVRNLAAIVINALEVIGAILEAAKAGGYSFPQTARV